MECSRSLIYTSSGTYRHKKRFRVSLKTNIPFDRPGLIMENKTMLKVDTSKTNAQSRICMIKFYFTDTQFRKYEVVNKIKCCLNYFTFHRKSRQYRLFPRATFCYKNNFSTKFQNFFFEVFKRNQGLMG